MKKTICIILCFTVLLACVGNTAFAKESCDCGYLPVIFVIGQGETLYLNEGTSSEKKVPDLSGALLTMIPKLILGIVLQAVSGDYEALGSLMLSSAKDLVEPIACDKNGNSKYNVTIRQEDFPVDGHHDALKYGESNNFSVVPADYKFKYDWRLDPVYNAQLLNDYIENVKKYTGHDKVIVMAHSEGNNVLSSYIYLYGSSSLEKVLFLAPAYQGLSILGSLFAGEYNISDKSDALVSFLDTLFEDTSVNNLIKSTVSILNKFGILRIVLNDAQNLLDGVYEQKIYDYLIDVLGTMPGMWSFCPDEYYERAKERAFGNKDGYDELIKKIDFYHENIQKHIPEMIDNLMKQGIKVSIVCGYGISTIPVSNSAPEQSDMMINTRYMSLGAKCADVGKTFDNSYVQKNDDGHNHVSPDMMIDASTCAFPDITWFVRDLTHENYANEYCDFLWSLYHYDGQCDVFSLDGYSQFMMLGHGNLENVTEKKSENNKPEYYIVLKSLYDIIKGKNEIRL